MFYFFINSRKCIFETSIIPCGISYILGITNWLFKGHGHYHDFYISTRIRAGINLAIIFIGFAAASLKLDIWLYF